MSRTWPSYTLKQKRRHSDEVFAAGTQSCHLTSAAARDELEHQIPRLMAFQISIIGLLISENRFLDTVCSF